MLRLPKFRYIQPKSLKDAVSVMADSGPDATLASKAQDLATVTGNGVSGFDPAGTLTYTFYSVGDCTPGTGNVCRMQHGNVTDKQTADKSFTGIRVYRDKLDRWASSRAMWNQHAYSITNVSDDGIIPPTSGTRRNWEQAGQPKQRPANPPYSRSQER